MKLYSGPVSMFGAKAEIALREKGVSFELEHVPFSLAKLYEPRHPEIFRINPKLQVPVLVDRDLEIYDSTQIFEYLEDLTPSPPLWPEEPKARARARLLELESDEVFFPQVMWLFPRRRAQASAEELEQATAAIAAFHARLDGLLEGDGRPYLAGPFSYADIAFVCAQYFAELLGQPLGAERAALRAWQGRMFERESVQKVLGGIRTYLESEGVSAPSLRAAS